METRVKGVSKEKNVNPSEGKKKTLYRSYVPKEPPDLTVEYRPVLFRPAPVRYDPESGRWHVVETKQDDLPKDVTVVYVPEEPKEPEKNDSHGICKIL